MARDDEPDDTDTPAPTRRPRDGSGTPRTRRTFDRYAADDDRPKRKAGFPLWAMLTIGFVGVGVCSGAAAIVAVVVLGRAASPANRTYSRDEFKVLVVGKTEAEVIQAVGKPDGTSQNADTTYWNFRQRTSDPVTGNLDFSAQVVIRGGVVVVVNY